MKKFALWMSIVLAITVLAATCGAAPTPQVIEREVVVEKEVVRTVVVEKEVPVEKEVVKEVEKVVIATAAAPPKGGTIVVATSSEPGMLDPGVGSNASDDVVNINIFDLPVYRDAELNFVPGLVEEWAVDSAGTTWTLKLRQGVKFHDGTPFNAEALKFNFDRIKNPDSKSRKAAGLLLSPESTVIDEYTLEVKYDKPYAAFLDAMSTPVLGVQSPASIEKWGLDVGRHPVGTGPFKFVEWVEKDHITLERNSDYNWQPPYMRHSGPAYIESLTFRFIPEDVARVIALETGEADVIIRLPQEHVARISTDPKYNVLRGTVVGSPIMMTVNATKFPTDDIVVRRALEYAINQEQVIQTALFNVGFRGYSPITQANPCYDSSLEGKYSYDPEQAQALLEEAGWKLNPSSGLREKNGEKLILVYITFPGAVNRRMAETIQSQLRAVGADIDIREMQSPHIQAARQAGEHNLAWLLWYGMDPAVLEVMLHSRNIGSGWNFTHFRSQELDSLLDAANAEMDAAKRCGIFAQAQQLAMDQAVVIPMILSETIFAYHANVKDLTISPHGYFAEWYDVYKE